MIPENADGIVQAFLLGHATSLQIQTRQMQKKM